MRCVYFFISLMKNNNRLLLPDETKGGRNASWHIVIAKTKWNILSGEFVISCKGIHHYLQYSFTLKFYINIHSTTQVGIYSLLTRWKQFILSPKPNLIIRHICFVFTKLHIVLLSRYAFCTEQREAVIKNS